MKKILLIILSLLAILFIGVVYASKQETQEQKKQEVLDVTVYSGYVITTTNSWQTVANYEEIEFKVTPPKKKVVKQSNWLIRKDWSLTHESWKKEMEAQKPYSTFEVQELIRKYSAKHWVDENLVLRMSWCESWYRYWAKNKQSSAWWAFQFINSTWNWSSNKYWRWWESRFNADANIDVAVQKIKNEWTSAWNESKKCRWK